MCRMSTKRQMPDAAMIHLRPLRGEERAWADALYREVRFLPLADNHRAWVAEVDGAPAGIGRLVEMEEDAAAELSGIVTLPAFRGLGVAERVVEKLIQENRQPTLYCIPLPELEGFYQRFGLEEVARNGDLPCALRTKLNMCDVTHAARVTLLHQLRGDALNLRPATLEDAPLLRRWDTVQEVISSDPDSDWEWETELGRDVDWREQWIMQWNGRDIGFLQIIDPQLEEGHYWGDCGPDLRAVDLWIGEPDCLGRGLGTRIMRIALARCFAPSNVKEVWVDPLASHQIVHPFYQRLGFEPVGERAFDLDVCLVHRLTRERWLKHRPNQA